MSSIRQIFIPKQLTIFMKKNVVTTIVLFFLFASMLTAKTTDNTSIVLKNTLSFTRMNELVEVAVPKTLDFSNLALFDKLGNVIAYQVLPCGKIVFPATVNAKSRTTYTLKKGTPATAYTKTFAAQKMQETRNDIVWENDLSAYRLYSRVLLSNEPKTANGQDIWNKKMAGSIIDKMYTYASYHSEGTEGVDSYSVNGRTLGAGGIVAYANDQLWLHDPYDSCKIISNGPLRTEFILTYKKVEIDGDFYTKTLRITTNANGLMNKAIVKFEGKIKPMKIASGIYLHDNMAKVTPAGIQYTTEKNLIGYAENPSEGKVTSPNARMYTGVYMPGKTTFSTINNQLVIMSDYIVGSEFTYYYGAGWNVYPAEKYKTDTDWFKALNQFKQTILNPLKINFSRLQSTKTK